jgi:hypothetical protein
MGIWRTMQRMCKIPFYLLKFVFQQRSAVVCGIQADLWSAVHMSGLRYSGRPSVNLVVSYCVRGFLFGVTVRAERDLFRWFSFFPAHCLYLTVRSPSVESDWDVPMTTSVDSTKRESRIRCCSLSDILVHTSTVRRCRTYCGWSVKSPWPHIARSASLYWLLMRSRRELTRSGSIATFHCRCCFNTWLMLSRALFVHWWQPVTKL